MALNVKYLGLTDYKACWLAMKAHIENNPKSDEIWVTEHNPIYTTGLNKKDSKLPLTIESRESSAIISITGFK